MKERCRADICDGLQLADDAVQGSWCGAAALHVAVTWRQDVGRAAAQQAA